MKSWRLTRPRLCGILPTGHDVWPRAGATPASFRRSSVVERAAVNRLVVGSNPTAGATLIPDDDPSARTRRVESDDRPSRSPDSRWTRRIGAVALGGLLIGILTSLGQGSLPFELSPLANSSGSWSLAAFALALTERVPKRAALLGAAALAAMLAGYSLATVSLGHAASTSLLLFWGAASVVVGPIIGVGAAWFRGPMVVRIGLGGAVIAGILIGEGVYGVTLIAATTPVGYWLAQIGVGLAFLLAVSLRRLRSLMPIAVCLATTAVVAAGFYVTYSGELIALLP